MKKQTDGGYSIPEEDAREILRDEELLEEMETYTGTCRFCGQMGTAKGEPGWEREQVNEAVTCCCQCSDAREYARQKEQIEKAKRRVREVFGTGAGEKALDIEIVESLYLFVDMLAARKLQAVTMDLGGGLKAAVARTAKGNIKVERTEIVKAKFEE